jgi:4-amino-4-deoxy-L-arabinose transferase-like glycosyltransferase
LGSGYYSFIAPEPQIDLALIILVAGISFTVASALIWLRNRHFIVIIGVGFYLALLLLFNSPHWLWELNNDFPVQPVATMLQEKIPSLQKIYTNHPYFRPSLEFYSDRVVIPQSNEQLEQLWQESKPAYLLINLDTVPTPTLNDQEVLGSVVSWQLITKK